MKASEFRKLFDAAVAGWPADELAEFEGIIRRDWAEADKRKAWIGTVQQLIALGC